MSSFKTKFNALIAAGLLMTAFSASADDPTQLSFQTLTQIPVPSRTIRLTGAITAETSIEIIEELKELDRISQAPITMIIHSGGGSVSDGLAIIDTMRSLRSKVNTVCEGEADSMAAFILIAGTGTRSSYENCTIMIHSLSAQTKGKSPDISIDAAEFQRTNKLLAEITSESTGLSVGTVLGAMRVNFYVSPQDAFRIGMIDEIIPAKHKRMVTDRNGKLPTDLAKRLTPQ